MPQVKFKSQAEFEAYQKKMAGVVPPQNPAEELPTNKPRGPEDQNVKTFNQRPDMREGSGGVEQPSAQTERQELNRKLRDMAANKEKSFAERHPTASKVIDAIKGSAPKVKEKLKQVVDNAEELEHKEEEPESEAEEEEEEEKKSKKKSKKGKKSKHFEEVEDFDEEEMEDRPSPPRKKKPFSDDYKEVYAPGKVMSGDYKEVFKGQMGSGTHKSVGVPKTHDGFLQHTPAPVPQQQQRAPAPQQQRAPVAMPKVGSFGNGNVKMPTVSFGGSMNIPKISTPSMGAHKMGKGGNMPSINIPTLGGSTLIVGSGLMGKTANNKMGVSKMGDIPKIGNWGKSPLKTELNLPNIGNLTIMGAGKKKGGINFGLGEVPSFSLGTPQKKKK